MKTNLNSFAGIAIVLSVLTLPLGSCSSATSGNNEVVENTKATSEVVSPVATASGPLADKLDKAKKEGKAVFIVVIGKEVTETDRDKVTTLAQNATALYKNSAIIHLDRDDAANATFVAEWRLTGAPLPLILVVSPKGQLIGGKPLAQATAENIAALVPSAKMEEVYAAMAASKTALVVFTKKSMSDRNEVLQEVKNAAIKLKNNAVIVEVDMDDAREDNFMSQLRIKKASQVSTTLVINSQGQVAGTSTSVPDAEKLVAAATTPVKSGCGPGCGPAGCGK